LNGPCMNPLRKPFEKAHFQGPNPKVHEKGQKQGRKRVKKGSKKCQKRGPFWDPLFWDRSADPREKSGNPPKPPKKGQKRVQNRVSKHVPTLETWVLAENTCFRVQNGDPRVLRGFSLFDPEFFQNRSFLTLFSLFFHCFSLFLPLLDA